MILRHARRVFVFIAVLCQTGGASWDVLIGKLKVGSDSVRRVRHAHRRPADRPDGCCDARRPKEVAFARSFLPFPGGPLPRSNLEPLQPGIALPIIEALLVLSTLAAVPLLAWTPARGGLAAGVGD